ncbi:hypothetical protein HME9302_01060 [Alteripontixanthobacter maritimus]|uniref:Uncharacterized protein n=1 Tax=Alteripontixanthobacter maritimus TaxID=2161824 RepID=A0A369Q561_9SPHN|nr:hypothetical protein [Alteripontixanthobacter maritimus]RDC59864.1 hypothetical protein HME9302_01060 [Alteripontixanthobacter maritimus]
MNNPNDNPNDNLPPMTATEDEVKPTKQAYRKSGDSDGPSGARNSGGADFVGAAQQEATGMLKDGMAHPSTKPVLTGAAIGAVAGAILPVVSLPLGLAAGAAYAFYKRVRP